MRSFVTPDTAATELHPVVERTECAFRQAVFYKTVHCGRRVRDSQQQKGSRYRGLGVGGLLVGCAWTQMWISVAKPLWLVAAEAADGS